MKDKPAKTKLLRGAAKDHILDVASRLFYTMGIRAVGIDTIVAQSGVAKTTLYDHFASKDDLIKAYLEKRDQVFWEDFEQSLHQHPDDPKQQFMDLFASLEQMIASPQSLGCPFLSAAAEYPELDQPGHQVALAHKQKLRSRLGELAHAAGVDEPEQLADQLVLLLDGAFASKRVFRSETSPAIQLRATVEMILEIHLGEG